MNLSKIIQKNHITLYLFLLVVVSLPVSRKIFTISLWPWILSWLIEGNFRDKFTRIKFRNGILPLWTLTLLFIIYTLSLLWSQNSHYAFVSLTEKVFLILMPFFLVFSTDHIAEENNLKLILKSFIVGMLITSLYLLFVAFSKSLSFISGNLSFHPMINDWENVFFNTNFTFMIHPSYYAMMILMAISLCLSDFQTRYLFKTGGIIRIVLIIYFVIIVLLTQSRSAFLALFALGIYHLFIFHIKTRIKLLICSLIIVFSLIYISDSFRFKVMKDSLSQSSESKISSLMQTNIRNDIWGSSFLIFKSSPVIGVGLGDVQDELNTIYKEKGYTEALEKELNCHNQFVETLLSTGLIGFLVLLFALFIPVFNTLIHPKSYYIGFLIIVISIFLFESVLKRVWGVAFFCLFYTLFTQTKGSIYFESKKINT